VASCQKSIIPNDPAGFDAGSDLARVGLVLQGPGVASGLRLLDLGTGQRYTLAEGTEVPEKIDLVMLWGSASGMNLIAPSNIARLNEWSAGQTINNTWLVKNTTTFVRIKSSATTQATYDGIMRTDDLAEAYQNALNTVEQQEGYLESEYGPGPAVRNLTVGDLVFMETEKQVRAVALVTNLATGTSGSLGLSMKIDVSKRTEIPPVPASERIEIYETELDRPGYDEGKRFLDFSTGTTYDLSAMTPQERHAFHHQEKIDVVFLNSADKGSFNFMSPDDEEWLASWSIGSDLNANWLVKNEGVFVKMDASAKADSIFLHSYRKSHLRNAFSHALAEVDGQEGYAIDTHGPGKHIGSLKVGDLIFFKSESKQICVMAKVTAQASGGAGTIALAVKVDRSEEIAVPPPPVRNLRLTGVGASTADFIDFSSVVVHKEGTAELNTAAIDVAHLRGSSTSHNFIAITNGPGFGAWTAALRANIEAWPVRNHAELINLGSAAEHVALYESLDERDREAMAAAFEHAKTLHTPTGRLSNVGTGDIIFINSVDRGIIVAIKVVESNPQGGLEIAFKISQN